MKLNNVHLIQRMLIERSVVDDKGCWNWTWCKSSDGYGRVTIDYKVTLAHRLSYRVFNGEFPDEMFICHHCDNPSCINPDHLFVGTMSDNMKDAYDKGILHPPHQFKKGDPNVNRKLSNEQVKEIKRLMGLGYQQKQVAKIFNVSPTTVMRIVKKRMYKEIE